MQFVLLFICLSVSLLFVCLSLICQFCPSSCSSCSLSLSPSFSDLFPILSFFFTSFPLKFCLNLLVGICLKFWWCTTYLKQISASLKQLLAQHYLLKINIVLKVSQLSRQTCRFHKLWFYVQSVSLPFFSSLSFFCYQSLHLFQLKASSRIPHWSTSQQTLIQTSYVFSISMQHFPRARF